VTQRAHDDEADVPVACRVRGSLEPQALGERDCWVAAAVDEIERRSKPSEDILGRESGEQLRVDRRERLQCVLHKNA